MKRLFLLMAALLFTACASDIMKSFVGKDISAVVVQYGPPVNVFDMPDGTRAFQWRQDAALILPTTTNYSGTTYGAVSTGTAITTGGYAGSYTCFYTLYTKPAGKDQWTVVGFEKPKAICE